MKKVNNESDMPMVLVTGAGGYIGTTLVPMLLRNRYRVRAIDRFFFGNDLLPKHPDLEVIKEDCRKLNVAHFQNVEMVIDLVAISNDPSGELFKKATCQINCDSRIASAKLAKTAGVSRYILPSSCSIYGFQGDGVIVNESSPTNPLTTYAKANEMAERGVLKLADENFCVVVLRQATVYGYSPRMRFDLAINGMTFGAWQSQKLPLMRDGTQWRPMVHVIDTALAQIFMLTAPKTKISQQIFNVGSDENNYQLGRLGELVADEVTSLIKGKVNIEWYGDPDHRSYRVAFNKIEALGYKANRKAEDGVREIVAKLAAKELDKTTRTMTLDWYRKLSKWRDFIKEVEMYGGIIDI